MLSGCIASAIVTKGTAGICGCYAGKASSFLLASNKMV